MHPDERQWAKDHAKDFAAFYEKTAGKEITQDQAENMLLANGYIRVDSAAASGGAGYDSTAAQYLTQNAGGLFTKDQYYNNPFAFGNADGSRTPEQLAMPGGVAHPVAGMVIGGAITGGLTLGLDAVAGVVAAVKACAANPVLCGNQVAITAGDVAAGSAMPAGTGAAVAGAAGAAAEAGPAKTASGDLNAAGNSARSQPYGNGASASPSLGADAAGSSGATAQLPSAANIPVTSGGAANASTLQGLKDQLANENLANIAARDPRLAAAVNGSGTSSPNFSIGSGTGAEANSLGQTWVGDGATLVSNQGACPGCLVSADGTRIYRPPQPKSSPYATTGVQANFVRQSPSGTIISNGHLNITP